MRQDLLQDLPLSLAFLAGQGFDPARLRAVARVAVEQRVAPAAALVAQGAISERAYMRALADHMGVPMLDREPPITRWQSGPEAKAPGFARLEDPRGPERWVLAPRFDQVEALLADWRRPDSQGVRLFLAAPSDYEAWYLAANGGACAQLAARTLQRIDPSLSAGSRARWGWRSLAIALSPIVLALGLGGLDGLRLELGLVGGFLFASVSLVRIFAATASCDASPAEPRPLPEAELPSYTVLVPLLREANILGQLVAALAALDYPRAKLDIRLLVEADDRETREALTGTALPEHIRPMVMPPGLPRGKPRALQIALPFARGELLTVFDAEDVPEPNQLRRAAAAFARGPARLACVQASLVIDNARDGWLTAAFALEYAALFDAVNPGLAALGWPILLGGTSNHFRTTALREAGGWDCWNVTEDADLGLRLARFGYRVQTLASTTDEEAPGRLGDWIGQRRRWLKGWMQTLATHARAPRRVLASLGPTATLAALATLLGGVLGPLLGPLFVIATALDLASGRMLEPRGAAEVLASTLSCFVLVIGPAALLWPLWLGARRRRPPHALRGFVTLPLYMALTSVAAWLAVWDLWRSPFHWRKTRHGLARTSGREGGLDRLSLRPPIGEAAAPRGTVPPAGPPAWLRPRPPHRPD